MKIVAGNLLDVKQGFIVQQCNCNTLRAKGLADAIEKRFPYCDVYKKRAPVCIRGNHALRPDTPGTYQLCRPPADAKEPLPTIVCLMAQWAPGKPGDFDGIYRGLPSCTQDSYEQRLMWFVEAFTAFLTEVNPPPDQPICLPYQIGCGLAGGDWNAYMREIEKLEDKFGREFVVYKLE
jgi:hypothetical protein